MHKCTVNMVFTVYHINHIPHASGGAGGGGGEILSALRLLSLSIMLGMQESYRVW